MAYGLSLANPAVDGTKDGLMFGSLKTLSKYTNLGSN